jgi:hypothetical protein
MSNPSPPVLDFDLLTAYEQVLRGQGIPVDQWRKPGLTSTEIQKTLDAIGLHAPIEARTWWEWHNGANPDGQDRVFGPWRDCLSLERAVAKYRQSRWIAEQSADDDLPSPMNDPDFRWNPAWLPIIGTGLQSAIGCSVAEDQPTPVRFIDFADQPAEYAQDKAVSFGQLITWWIDAMNSGAWHYNQTQARCEVHRDLLDDELRVSSLV